MKIKNKIITVMLLLCMLAVGLPTSYMAAEGTKTVNAICYRDTDESGNPIAVDGTSISIQLCNEVTGTGTVIASADATVNGTNSCTVNYVDDKFVYTDENGTTAYYTYLRTVHNAPQDSSYMDTNSINAYTVADLTEDVFTIKLRLKMGPLGVMRTEKETETEQYSVVAAYLNGGEEYGNTDVNYFYQTSYSDDTLLTALNALTAEDTKVCVDIIGATGAIPTLNDAVMQKLASVGASLSIYIEDSEESYYCEKVEYDETPEESTEEDLLFPTGEYTLDTVTLGVGSVFALSNENIDKLISQDVVDLNEGVSRLYFDESIIIDSNYVSKTLYYGFYDADTMELVRDGYWTAEESNEFFNTAVDGKWFYEGKEVVPVEEGEGIAYYHIRADKAGATTVVIPYYQVEDAVIKLTIPFNIVETSVSEPAIPEPETPVENVITSTTDSTISISDSTSVLPMGTTIYTAKVESGDSYDFVISTVQNNVVLPGDVAVYDINLFDGENVELNQLNGKVKVTMDIPFEVAPGNTITVYRVEGTTLIPCVTSIVNNKLVFETDHFSTYVAVEELIPIVDNTQVNATQTTPDAETTTDPVTSPKTGDIDMSGYFVIMCMAVSMFILVNRKNVRA